MSLFKERIPYKPFEYPIYYTEGWLKQAQAFWLHTEIPMSGDVKDRLTYVFYIPFVDVALELPYKNESI